MVILSLFNLFLLLPAIATGITSEQSVFLFYMPPFNSSHSPQAVPRPVPAQTVSDQSVPAHTVIIQLVLFKPPRYVPTSNCSSEAEFMNVIFLQVSGHNFESYQP
jgi:hypothetical protein